MRDTISSDKKALALDRDERLFLVVPPSFTAASRRQPWRVRGSARTRTRYPSGNNGRWSARLGNPADPTEPKSLGRRLGGHFQRDARRRISARAALCGWYPRILVLVSAGTLCNCAPLSLFPARDNKIAPAMAGASALPLPLSRRIALPELAPCAARSATGCRASSGRFPPPLWIRARAIRLLPYSTMPSSGCHRFGAPF